MPATIYSLVENNFGVSIVPTSLQKGFDRKVKFIELDQIKLRTTLFIIWNSDSKNPVIENALSLVHEIQP